MTGMIERFFGIESFDFGILVMVGFGWETNMAAVSLFWDTNMPP